METAVKTKEMLRGGEWLIKESNADDVFFREDMSEEQLMIYDMCQQFMKSEVIPVINRIDNLEPGLMPMLLEKCGDAGLLGVSVPEIYGGLEKDAVTSNLVSEALGTGYSFSVAYSAHTGIGTLPILYFGTEAQKEKYLPKLVSGEWKASYGLTEPGSGSDALGAKTTATLTEDGKYYVLNGQKCWITNGGFANVFTVFAKIKGKDLPPEKSGFTAFILEKGMEGFTQGPEEHKMGIKGSSTVQLFFQDCKVPVENVLGEIGRGHIIAFNILNIGRIKLGSATLGASKVVISDSVDYAINREQFKTSIANFGAIKFKLAEMVIKTWISGCGLFRTAKMMDDKEQEILKEGKSFSEALLGAAEEYAIECAILKVVGSEVLNYAVDEGVQIHGGNGFSDEYNISRAYRDCRINRIFEGTNEINRLLIVDMTLKRALNGRLNLLGPASEVAKELMSIPDMSEDDSLFSEEKKYIANFKKAILMVAGAAVQKLMTSLKDEQEIIMNIADMAIYTFLSESALLRLIKMTHKSGEEKTGIFKDMVFTYIHDAADHIHKAAKDAINAFASGDELRMMQIGLKRFTKTQPYNSKDARRRIADYMIEKGKYPFT
ncbi:MAG: acyl-CoA dehydrogenase family protein [Bacteroidetes bacterium]|nr:acyl-CoA dehydrogenase family protein [Bacteroidota bacterium]